MAIVRRLTINPPLTEAEFAWFCAANPSLKIDRDPSGVIIVRDRREDRDDHSVWLLSQRGTITSEIDLDDDERSSVGTDVHKALEESGRDPAEQIVAESIVAAPRGLGSQAASTADSDSDDNRAKI